MHFARSCEHNLVMIRENEDCDVGTFCIRGLISIVRCDVKVTNERQSDHRSCADLVSRGKISRLNEHEDCTSFLQLRYDNGDLLANILCLGRAETKRQQVT